MKMIDREKNYSAFFGVLLIGICLFVWYNTSFYPAYLSDARSTAGPRVFPRILGILLALGGIYEIAGAFVVGRATSPVERWGAFFRSEGGRNIVWFIVLTALFVPLVRLIGFAIGSTVYSVVLMRKYGVKLWVAGLVTIVVVMLIMFVFGYVFKIPLPVGELLAPLGWRY